MRAVAEEHRRLRTLLTALTAEEWAAPTACTEWDVRAMVAHLAGAARSQASVRETVRQLRHGPKLRPGADAIDGINELQVRERADHTPAALLAELADVEPRALRARSRLPRIVRALPIPFGPPLGTAPLGYLLGPIYTRDAWMHRVDIAQATGRRLELSADHDGAIVQDVVAEWAQLHGQPYELTLTGPAGGRWRRGHGGEVLELDAVTFCLTVSGRAAGAGLLATRVNF